MPDGGRTWGLDALPGIIVVSRNRSTIEWESTERTAISNADQGSGKEQKSFASQRLPFRGDAKRMIDHRLERPVDLVLARHRDCRFREPGSQRKFLWSHALRTSIELLIGITPH
jgi:hypothetical protein